MGAIFMAIMIPLYMGFAAPWHLRNRRRGSYPGIFSPIDVVAKGPQVKFLLWLCCYGFEIWESMPNSWSSS